MTEIIIAIAIWCGGSPSYLEPIKDKGGMETYAVNVKYGCQFDKCRQKALECMAKAQWNEKKLPQCLGDNLK